jgi:hypothetical protein
MKSQVLAVAVAWLTVGCSSSSDAVGSAEGGPGAGGGVHGSGGGSSSGGTSSSGGSAGASGGTSARGGAGGGAAPPSDPGFVSCYPRGAGARCDLAKGEVCCEPKATSAGRPWGTCVVGGGAGCAMITACDEDADCPAGQTCTTFVVPGVGGVTRCSGGLPGTRDASADGPSDAHAAPLTRDGASDARAADAAHDAP